MKPQFVEMWIDYYEVESSTGYRTEFFDFDEADKIFNELRKANPDDTVRFLAVIAES